MEISFESQIFKLLLMPLLQNRLAQAVVFWGRTTLKGPKSRMWLSSRSLPNTALEHSVSETAEGHVASTSRKPLEAAKKIRIYMLQVLKLSNGGKRNLKLKTLASSFLGVTFLCVLITSYLHLAYTAILRYIR
uniref:Transmembrane protein n=1 Tax=Pipistrellus kuhlii TaxID=59472 RepID=A0A7J7WD63_PIPKU|nr:hypothetical protein mPipKuh1_008047 [Pipistrellus kuhlii]